MKIRKAKLTDAKRLHELGMSLGAYYNDDTPSGISPFFENIISIESFEKYLTDTKAYEHYVYEEKHQVVAYFSLVNETHFFLLFVDEKHHSKGIGRALVEHALEGKRGEEFTLNASLYAVPFYEKLGFKSSALVQTHHGMTYMPMIWKRLLLVGG